MHALEISGQLCRRSWNHTRSNLMARRIRSAGHQPSHLMSAGHDFADSVTKPSSLDATLVS